VSENRPEWALADYACLTARATDVPIYPTITPKQTEYILRDSEAVATFVSTAAQLDKILEVKGNLPGLKHVIVFDSPAAAQRRGDGIVSSRPWRRRPAAASKHPNGETKALEAQPDDLATLIYTSGTTAIPKASCLRITTSGPTCRPCCK